MFSSFRLLRQVARLLTLVMLLTVFSPSFGWEAVDGAAPHEHLQGLETQGVAAEEMDCHKHSAALTGGHETPLSTASADLDHHCCPGHVLGHLLGGVGASSLPLLLSGNNLAVDRRNRTFSSRVPEGLERPPRLAA